MNEYNETIKELVKEQFGTGPISEKVWLVLTDDRNNMARQPVENGRFHPAILLEGIHNETAAGAAATVRRCMHGRVYGVVETVQEAMEMMPNGPMVMWNGKMVRWE